MKTVLVDALDTFCFEDKTINQTLHELLETFPNRKILVSGANDEQIKQWGLDQMPYEVFTLKHNPEKVDPKFFKLLLEKYELSSNDVIYFEHNPAAVKSAELTGIKSYYYDPEKKDLIALNNFLMENI